MSETIVITVLVENSVEARDLMAEHGLAFHVQAGAESVLFDTGQSDLLVHNARRLDVDLSGLHALALSHGHYDHTGGVGAGLELAPGAEVYAHPAALRPHRTRNPDGTTRDVGISKRSLEAIQTHVPRPHLTPTVTELVRGLFLTGEIPRETSFEDVGGPFVLDEAGTQPDPLLDDQALFFDTAEGIVVLLGCAHAGAVNTLQYIRRLAHNRPIHAALGGMHLLTAGPERMARTVQVFRELGVNLLAPAHCTGIAATARLWYECPNVCSRCSVGSRFMFHR